MKNKNPSVCGKVIHTYLREVLQIMDCNDDINVSMYPEILNNITSFIDNNCLYYTDEYMYKIGNCTVNYHENNSETGFQFGVSNIPECSSRAYIDWIKTYLRDTEMDNCVDFVEWCYTFEDKNGNVKTKLGDTILYVLMMIMTLVMCIPDILYSRYVYSVINHPEDTISLSLAINTLANKMFKSVYISTSVISDDGDILDDVVNVSPYIQLYVTKKISEEEINNCLLYRTFSDEYDNDLYSIIVMKLGFTNMSS